MYYHIRKMVRIAVSLRVDRKMGPVQAKYSSGSSATGTHAGSPDSPAGSSYSTSFRSFGSTTSMFGSSSNTAHNTPSTPTGESSSSSSHLSTDHGHGHAEDANSTSMQSTRRRADSTLRDYRTLLLTQDREEAVGPVEEPYAFTGADLGKSGDTFVERLLDTQSFSNYCYDYSQKGLGAFCTCYALSPMAPLLS